MALRSVAAVTRRPNPDALMGVPVYPARTVRHDCQVIRRINALIPSPISGSAAARPTDHREGAGDDREADEGICSWRVPVGDQSRAVEGPSGAEAN